jgi:glycerophosphoryl diester phosphodiesterase
MRWKVVLGAGLVIAGGIWAFNTTVFTNFPRDNPIRLIAHRGQHQPFDSEGVGRDTCTASRILKPTHSLLENTIPSMQAAFQAGADVVELDIHLTPDNHFAVFHDWTLDCRTNAEGVTEETPMDLLKTLDIGHGYTADGGQTFPFRGTGVGMMPTLTEVFDAIPAGRFLINFKSRRSEEGEALARMLRDNSSFREATVAVYGGGEPTEAAKAGVKDLRGFSASGMKTCLMNYLLLGWSGHVPQECQGTLVMVPANYALLLWGWPERFYQRMQSVGSEVIILGPFAASDVGSSGVDTPADWDLVPDHFPGYVWTNRIEDAAAHLRRRGFCEREIASRPPACQTAEASIADW